MPPSRKDVSALSEEAALIKEAARLWETLTHGQIETPEESDLAIQIALAHRRLANLESELAEPFDEALRAAGQLGINIGPVLMLRAAAQEETKKPFTQAQCVNDFAVSEVFADAVATATSARSTCRPAPTWPRAP